MAHPRIVVHHFCAEGGMGPSLDLQLWAGRLCLGLVALLAMLGYHYGNVRFVPVATGFAILAGVFYSARVQRPTSAPSLADSGRHRAI